MTDSPGIRRPSEADLRQSFEGYRRALSKLSTRELMELAATQSAAIQQTQLSALSQLLTSSTPDLDQPVQRSTSGVSPSGGREVDRGQRPSPPSRQPSSLELLASRSRMGPRLAAKLVAADARRRTRR